MTCRIRNGKIGRSAGSLVVLLALFVGLFWSPVAAVGGISNTATVSQVFGDDNNTATLNPYPLISVSSITYAGHPELAGQCTWINTALTNFVNANPNDGSGASGQGWSYTWAGVAQEQKVEQGLSLYAYTAGGTNYNGYNPYVVTQPDVVAANGKNYPSDIKNAETGGAVLNLKYTPVAGAPAITNLHWIQAYTGSIKGTNFGPILDNDPNHPYVSQANNTPFYDSNYTAGTLGGGGGWFLDTPFVTEREYENNPVVSVQFQVVLVSDTITQTPTGAGGAMVTQNALTLYGGDWWGYTYNATEIPEPSTVLMMMIGGGGVALIRSRFGRHRRRN